MDERMRDVAEAGDIEALYALIQENSFVLKTIDDYPFVDTPLHIAVFKGHIDFAMEMMNLKPSYARKLNPAGLSPMHLAVLNCKTEAVRELLKVDKDLVRVKGRGSLTPLHYAVKKRDLDLIAEFLEACPQCITDVNVQGQNAIHIATSDNNFETLELLVCWLEKTTHRDADIWNKQVLNGIDREGNTVLHIAASINNLQMVRLLLECKMISKNKVNLKDQSALDMLSSQVNKSETEKILRQAGCLEAKSFPKRERQKLAESLKEKMSWLQKLRRTITRKNNMISSDMRNAMLVVAVLILTASYQTCLSPPGGVRQSDSGDNDSGNSAVAATPSSAPSTPLDLFFERTYQFAYETRNKVGFSVMSAPRFIYLYLINTATFLTTTSVVFLLLPDYTINLLTLPVMLFILCYLLSMAYLAPFPIPDNSPVHPFVPIIVATLLFLVVCLPKFFNLNLQS